MGNLVNLVELDLSDNLISTLPKSFDKLVFRIHLSLEGNPLSILPNSSAK